MYNFDLKNNIFITKKKKKKEMLASDGAFSCSSGSNYAS